MSIIIEKKEYPLMKGGKVYLTLNFQSSSDPSNIIGEVLVRKDNKNKYYKASKLKLYNVEKANNLKALLKSSNKIKFYLAIGGKGIKDDKGNITEVELLEVSICTSNVDKSIPSIKFEDLK